MPLIPSTIFNGRLDHDGPGLSARPFNMLSIHLNSADHIGNEKKV